MSITCGYRLLTLLTVKNGYANVPKSIYFILETLGIKGPNINVYAVNTIQNNSEVIGEIKAKLTYPIKRCCHCGFDKVVKNGLRKNHIRLASLDGVQYKPILWKQCYYCKCCNSTFDAITSLTEENRTLQKSGYAVRQTRAQRKINC